VWLLLAKGDTMGIKISKGQRDKGQIHQLAFWHLAFQNPYFERDKMPNAKCQNANGRICPLSFCQK